MQSTERCAASPPRSCKSQRKRSTVGPFSSVGRSPRSGAPVLRSGIQAKKKRVPGFIQQVRIPHSAAASHRLCETQMSLILRALSRCTMHGPLNRFGRHYPIAQSSRIRRPFVSQRRKGKTGPTPPESLKNETAPSGKHRRPPGLGRRLLGYLLFRTFGLRKASGFKSSMQRRTESRLAKLKYTKIINKKRRFQPGLLKDFFPGFRWVDMAAFGAIMAAQLVGVRARDHRATVQVRVGDVQMNRFWLLPLVRLCPPPFSFLAPKSKPQVAQWPR